MSKILVVDDDTLVREMLQQMLEKEGYKTVAAADGEEAIKKFHKYNPDLIVTDIIMPEKEGIELIQIFLREDPMVKIIAISGGALNIDSQSTLKMAKALGAHSTLTKPLSREEFVSQVKKLLVN
ncbi:MAG: response regulator [Calditrichaeota bacterium]|nr:MAG: response regulator [Calditrichota bacterium]MBL1205324.1 response regulator [Calditrichota bacterium]NOG45153.1 response regulator [Calditrichota bacterium]